MENGAVVSAAQQLAVLCELRHAVLAFSTAEGFLSTTSIGSQRPTAHARASSGRPRPLHVGQRRVDDLEGAGGLDFREDEGRQQLDYGRVVIGVNGEDPML